MINHFFLLNQTKLSRTSREKFSARKWFFTWSKQNKKMNIHNREKQIAIISGQKYIYYNNLNFDTLCIIKL